MGTVPAFWGKPPFPLTKNFSCRFQIQPPLLYPSFVYALATRASHLEYHSQASPPARLPDLVSLTHSSPLPKRLTNSGLRMPWRQQRKSTRVHDPQPLHTVNSSLGINDCVRIVLRSHGAYVPQNISTQAQAFPEINIPRQKHRMSYTWPQHDRSAPPSP